MYVAVSIALLVAITVCASLKVMLEGRGDLPPGHRGVGCEFGGDPPDGTAPALYGPRMLYGIRDCVEDR